MRDQPAKRLGPICCRVLLRLACRVGVAIGVSPRNAVDVHGEVSLRAVESQAIYFPQLFNLKSAVGTLALGVARYQNTFSKSGRKR